MSTLPDRIDALESAFRHIAATRMRGLPLLHAPLQVQAVGFAPAGAGWALGVLVTPWFMNLLRLPLQPLVALPTALPTSPAPAATPACLAIGQDGVREIGGESLHFIGAHEPRLGHYEVCSLFSPMFQFVDQAAAVATAHEVLRLLRQPAAPPQPERRAAPPLPALPAAASAAPESAPQPAPNPQRRGLLFGRLRAT